MPGVYDSRDLVLLGRAWMVDERDAKINSFFHDFKRRKDDCGLTT